MHRNNELHQFLLDKTWQLTEDWYKNLDKRDPSGVYASEDPMVINSVKQQNYEFHKKFCEVFIKEESSFFNDFEKWIVMVAQDEQHLGTPVQFIIREFFRTQDQYLDLIDQFIEEHKDEYSKSEENSWCRITIKTFSKIIAWFTEEHNNHSQKRLQAQQELIMELSSPVISLNTDVALLPLVGDIDTARAKFILENTLEQCARLRVSQLFLDLSGVVLIDTMVAHQLFQLINALNLIGVKTTLSGLRPEIARTAVQLGLSFEKVTIKSTLSSAIKSSKLSM
ncbi:STAS domain-containing protein [Neobacillus sp. PS3-34]|uniref:STAS domain-containing protein n=1 Tax=Neobacillus sp. PS3-34 TaxID=3070678 RepID=UPI0027DF5D8B|nr:STAS domain-containing protein [Neobacillus sp. PS3-34]WML47598.1 STAS domain-containing protein [Neobacillus sp. PS3-34]